MKPSHPEQTRSGGFFFAPDVTARRALFLARFAHIRAVEMEFWRRGKTRTVQFMAGVASFLWALTLLGEKDTSFQNQAFTMMREQLPAWGWALVFIGHSTCVFACRWSAVVRLRFQWWTSLYGFVIWTYYVGSSWWSARHPLIGTSFELVGIFMLAWSLRRAGHELAEAAAHAEP